MTLNPNDPPRLYDVEVYVTDVFEQTVFAHGLEEAKRKAKRGEVQSSVHAGTIRTAVGKVKWSNDCPQRGD